MKNPLDKLFKALNDPQRRRILELLRKEDLTAGQIADRLNTILQEKGQSGISKPSISHHLKELKAADLILGLKKGQFIYYSINTSVLEEVMTWILDLKD